MISMKNREANQKRNGKGMFRRLTAMVSALMMLVSSSGLPSFALAEEPLLICGLEEHHHTAECFPKVLICGREEEAEQTETVKVWQNTFEVHVHDDSC